MKTVSYQQVLVREATIEVTDEEYAALTGDDNKARGAAIDAVITDGRRDEWSALEWVSSNLIGPDGEELADWYTPDTGAGSCVQ